MEIFGKMFFSLKMSKKPMKATFITIGANIILNLIFVRFWGANGLALATSMASAIGVLVIALQARPLFHQHQVRLMSPSFIKYGIAGLAMFACLLVIRALTPLGILHPLVICLISAGLGAAVYLGVLLLMKAEEVVEIIDHIRRRLMRGNS